MRNADGRLVFSATDLSLHLACPHLTTLRRAEACGEITTPLRYDDPRAEALKQRGIEHEQRILERLAAEGRTVATIIAPGAPFARQDLATAAARTADALRRGVDVVYQGRLRSGHGRWSGYPDFLLRVETPSALGAWSYEVADAKLARTARGTALLQLLLYSDLLAALQGHEPERMHLALGGGGDGHIDASFRVVEYAAYYRAVRRTFEAGAEAPPETYPEPVDHCRLCDWNGHCLARRRDDDHLSQVAGITRGQRQRLVARDIPTMAALGGLSLPVDPAIDGVSPAALGRIREQARVQDAARQGGARLHELIEPVEPDRGLAALPEPSAGDLFFDLEGDAFAGEGGLEYLFGFADRDGRYDARWALDAAAERREFERFIDSVMERWERHPGFHIYHYAPYETTAVKRLMSRHATREEEVDKLLRGRVFVDLYRIVRQGLRASVESYSIKKLEPFYGFARDVALGEATRSLIDLELRLESGNGAGVPDELRAEIEGYNRDDCLSTLRLADWLESCRAQLEARTGEPVPRPAPRDEEREQERESAAEVQAVFEALVDGLPEDEEALDDEQRARRLLAHLLEFHRREDKSTWWEFFDRCGMGPEELVEHRATLGGLTYTGAVEQIKRSTVHRYRFPEQTHEIEVGDTPKNPETAETDDLQRGFCGTVFAVDEAGRTIDLKRGRNSPVPHPAALVPLDTVNSNVLRASLLRLAREVASRGFAPDSPRRAAFDLLLRVPPRLGAVAPPGAGSSRHETVVGPGEAPLDAVRRIAPRLDRSVLPVQGPPGSGKTYTGAQMILDLLADGKRVGVTANSHKVISNLLDAVCRAADAERGAREGGVRKPGGPPAGGELRASAGGESGASAAGESGESAGDGHNGAAAPQAPAAVRGIQKANAGDGCPDRRIKQTGTNEDVADALATGEANLAGGTAWLWAREEMADTVDVLVIDEAGQMSLANTLAVCQAARSLVLLGDPRQLDQPIQGVHPPGADVSSLGRLLGESPTVDPSRGVFLDRTWRMHPEVCAFTSEQFYEGRLGARPELSRQTVLGPGPLAGQGLRYVPVAHAGNSNASAEEAEQVAALIRDLLDAGATWVDSDGVPHPLTLKDVLVVAPYNAHVAELQAALPDGARVGTVDRFQGQEAPIVLYSMATSSAADAPRGMEFLYSLHRLNVATSRARCVAAIVASPVLLTPDCRTPRADAPRQPLLPLPGARAPLTGALGICARTRLPRCPFPGADAGRRPSFRPP